MKDYELTVLFHPDLETNLDPALDKVKNLIETNGGKIVKIEPEGKKRLAYHLKGQDFAIYYYYDLQLPAEAPNKLTSTMGITDEILRAMLVKTDARKARYEEYLKSKSAEESTDSAESAESTEETKTETKEEEA